VEGFRESLNNGGYENIGREIKLENLGSFVTMEWKEEEDE